MTSPSTRQSQGAALRRLRTARGLTTREMGARVGTSHVFMLDVESGKRGLPPERIEATARALGVEVTALRRELGIVKLQCAGCGKEEVNERATKSSALAGMRGWRFIVRGVLACSEECQAEIERREGVVPFVYLDTQRKMPL